MTEHPPVADAVPRRRGIPTSRAIWMAVWGLSATGIVAVILYAASTPGRHLTYIGTGVLTAFAAGLTGGFFGFLLGIPRAVSSGDARKAMPMSGEDARAPGVAGAAPRDSPMTEAGAARFVQSTNLAEVSDWLTKLLLGAGLVSLTKLGKPASHLFHVIAGGLARTVNGAALVMAGAIVLTYVSIGFMATYIGTSIWYTRLLEKEE